MSILGDTSEVSSVEFGSDTLSEEQQGRGQFGPIRRSQRQLDRDTRQTEEIRSENQEIMKKDDPSIGKELTAAPNVRGRLRERVGMMRGGSRSRPRKRTRHLANQELSSSRVSESDSESDSHCVGITKGKRRVMEEAGQEWKCPPCLAGLETNSTDTVDAAEEYEAPNISDINDEDFIEEFLPPPNVASSSLVKTAAGSGQTASQPKTTGMNKSHSEGEGARGEEEGGQGGEKMNGDILMGRGRLCEACGTELASVETLPEHLVAIHLSIQGLCNICGEHSEDFLSHFKCHLKKSSEKVDSNPMVMIKAELLENSDFNQTYFDLNENIVKEEAKVGRLARNPFFSSSFGRSAATASNSMMELLVSPSCQGLVNSPGMHHFLVFVLIYREANKFLL